MVGSAVCPTGHMTVSWWQDTMDLTFEAVPKDTRKPTLVTLAECTAVRLTSRRFRMEEIPKKYQDISYWTEVWMLLWWPWSAMIPQNSPSGTRCCTSWFHLPWELSHGSGRWPSELGLGRLSWAVDVAEAWTVKSIWNSSLDETVMRDGSCGFQRSILPLEERKKNSKLYYSKNLANLGPSAPLWPLA